VRPIERTSSSGKRIDWPRRADEDFALAVGLLHGQQRVVFLDAHADDAAGARLGERLQVGLLDRPCACPSR
jgi:hypothetical protein